MRRASFLFAAFAALAFLLAPMLADARVGSSTSSGSRGTQTYTAPPSTSTAPSGAQPMQRSMTPNAPSATGSSAMGTSGYGRSGGFMSGLMGGIVGAGIFGMMFGHGMFGGIDGFSGFLGFLLQIGIVVMIGYFLVRLFRGPRLATAGGPSMFVVPGAAPVGATARPGAPPVAITPADFTAFEQMLKDMQAAWSAQNLPALQALATPEMVSYFSEQLSEQASRGVRNTVSDVHLEHGDLAEAWAEPGREYATVAMRFSMIDCTLDATGRVVDGSPTEHVTATELWTFLRAPGGRWLLSAIQQTR
jgi:predicted lipid-binding transport protein (Tim44 family)